MQMANEAREAIKAAVEKLSTIQQACSHPIEAREIINRAYDGYSEPTVYTALHKCGICGKSWVEDQ